MKNKKRKNANTLPTFKRLLGYLFKNYRLQLLFVIILILVSSVANIAGTLFMRNLIDDYITPYLGDHNSNFTPLLRAILGMAVVYGVGVFSTWAYSRLMVTVSQGTLKRLRDDVFIHMESLPIRYFDTNAHGDIMSVYTNDTDTLRQMISQSLPQLFSGIVTILGVIISMLLLNIPMTLLAFLMIGIMYAVTKTIAGKSSVYFGKQQHNIGKVNGYIEEMMEGQKVVKVFCYEQESMNKFNELNEELFESADHANRYANVLMPIMGNIGNIFYVLTALIGALLALYGVGGFTLGALAAFLQFTRTLNQPISQMSQQLNSVIMALAGSERIFALLDEEPETDEGYVELVNAKVRQDGSMEECKERTGMWAWKHTHQSDGVVEYKPMEGDVAFDHVDFGYTDEKMILHDIELYAKPGEKIAFVGATGAGKTTITNLINRFYDIQDGKIRYDGININKMKKSDLRRSLGIVLQDTHLFTGTVMENIRFGKLDASDEEVIAAAKLANAHHFIKHLPEGYDTMLTGDGANLSQGQRQLLSIARAAIANPPVLILDEATSSIDTRTEKIVQDGMDRLMEGRTVFVIAHRLSTIKNANVIMVLDKGRIIERGDHDSLLERKGVYYQLYTVALETD